MKDVVKAQQTQVSWRKDAVFSVAGHCRFHLRSATFICWHRCATVISVDEFLEGLGNVATSGQKNRNK